MVLEALERVDRFAASRGIRMRLYIFDQEGMQESYAIKGDRDLLLALFQNLLENAVKYSPVNGLVELNVVDAGEFLRVSVSDRGPGIAKEELPHLFQRFYRSPQTSQKAEGVGLGLAIAQKISEVHGGHLTVSSKVGEGTTFIFEIRKA
jgi:signal transduction histidine kinase